MTYIVGVHVIGNIIYYFENVNTSAGLGNLYDNSIFPFNR